MRNKDNKQIDVLSVCSGSVISVEELEVDYPSSRRIREPRLLKW
jgi:hypothetical protein